MNTNDLIRRAVIKSNSYPLFKSLNRVPYFLALKYFVKNFSHYNEIKSIYLRHGLTEKNWVPGISDIDLTVIIDSKISPEKTYHFLKKFWKKFERLKKIFPMIGEADILSENEFSNWSRFNIRGYDTQKWKLLSGDELRRNNYDEIDDILAIDSLNFAFTSYIEYFLPKFYSSEKPDFVKISETKRITNKILKYSLQYFKTSFSSSVSDKINNMLHSVLNAMEKAAGQIEISEYADSEIYNDNSVHQEKHHKVENEDYIINELISYKDVIASYIVSYSHVFIIIKNNMSDTDLDPVIEKIKKVNSKSDLIPLIVTYPLFEYFLRFYRPGIYFQLLRGRKVVLGEDLFKNIKPPYCYFYKKSLIDQSTNLFLSPYKSFLFNPEAVRKYLKSGFHTELVRGLFLKLFLEKNITEPDYTRCYLKCEEYFKEEFLAYKEITSANNGDEEKLSYDIFLFLKKLTSEVNNSLTNWKNQAELV